MPHCASSVLGPDPSGALVGSIRTIADIFRTDDRYDLAACGLLGGLLLLVIITFDDYGITWDETWHMRYGDAVLAWYRSGFSDTRALSYRDIYLYGGGFDALGALLRRLSSADHHTTMHLFGACVGWFGLFGTWRLGRLLGGARAGFWSLALLAVTPVFWGHMFANPKDLPFAVGYVWASLAIFHLRRQLPRPSARAWVGLGIALGLATSVRIGGLFTLCYAFLAVVLTAAHRAVLSRSRRVLAHDLWAMLPPLTVALVTAYGIMLVAWPWAQLGPLQRPLVAMRSLTHFGHHERSIPFRGQSISSGDVPWDYIPTYLTIKLPEIVVILVLAGVILLGVAIWRRRGRGSVLTEPSMLAVFILLPPLYAIARGTPLYDGLRHFLFLVPPLCVAAALTFEVGLGWLERRRRALVPVALVVMAIVCADQARIMAHLHPHEYVFFNRFVGGLRGADGRYSLDYYGNSHREAADGLLDYLRRTEPEHYLEREYRVSACVPGAMLEPFLPPTFTAVREHAEADFHIGYRRRRCAQRWKTAPIINEVRRFDTVLSVVRDRRAPSG
jgi:hypothetical protein